MRYYHLPEGSPIGGSKSSAVKAVIGAARDFSGSGVASQDSKKLEMLRGGGFSMNARGEAPKSGFMVSLHNSMGGNEKTLSGHATLADISAHRAAVEKQLQADPTLYHGGWNEGPNDTLDISKNHSNMTAAYIAAVRHQQRAVYDVEHDKVIPTDELGAMLRNQRRGKGTIHP